AKPPKESAPTMKPRRKPNVARRLANATMIQSSPVTGNVLPARAERRPDRLRRARPMMALAAVAFAIGMIVGAGHGASARDRLAARFVGAWVKGDYARMYLEIDAPSRRAISAAAFAGDYERALRTA